MDLNTCDKSCIDCIKKYKKKHSLTGKEKKPFRIPCNGIPQEYIDKDVCSVLPPEEIKTALTMLDPVTWAAEVLDWHCLDPDGEIWKRKNPEEYTKWVKEHPGEDILGRSRYHRPYQAVMLRCSANRKVFRIGRQAGKCLASGTLIQMADGTQKPVEEIQDGDLVVSVNDQYKSVINKAYRACNGVKPTYRVTLMDGRQIEATGNHPFLSRKNVGRETTGNRRAIFRDEWIEANKLTTDDYLAVPTRIEVEPVTLGGSGWPGTTVVGCMLADGNITGRNCRFSNKNPVILEHLREAVEHYGCSLKQYESDQSDCDYHIVGQGSGKSHRIKDAFREMGIQGLDSHQKYIPDYYMSRQSNEDVAHLLKCMFGCDGWASVCKDGSVEIGYSTVSEKLAGQIISLLARFDIYASCQKKIVYLDGKRFYSRQITITRKRSVKNFRNYVGILGKEDAVEAVYKVSQAKNSSPKTEAYEDNDITFVRVREISYVGEKMTWDLTVPETHNFVANNIVTHNTETLVISVLFHLFTKPGVPENEGFRIIIIAPYQAQVDLIFNRIDELLSASSLATNSIASRTKSPPRKLILHNKSVLIGFTAGTKSGGNADSVRGQKANMLVFDEADYLNPGDLDSALAIITNYPDATVWMSSTPKGTRDTFYNTCHLRSYREFHFPASVNPLWSEELDNTFREQMTEIAYKHEALAIFGEQEEGVFQNSYVQKAKSPYTYGQYKFDPRWVYTIGVDWNDVRIGTSIVVVGFEPSTGHFYLVDKQIVSREGWQQLAACQKIAEMNQFWRPAFIYIDSGYGATNKEILRKYGYDSARDPNKGPNHPDAKLQDIVKDYNFGGNVEIHDLITKQPVKKPSKPFLVENTVRRFETGTFHFPETDEHLEKQLLGYIVDHVTSTGSPVYKATDEKIGDHTLDAVMLALVAFTLEKTDFGKPTHRIDFTFAGKFGEKTMPDNDGIGIIVKNDKKVDPRRKNKPNLGRADDLSGEQASIISQKELPASHTNTDAGVRLWAWPGFEVDAPKPKISSPGKRRMGTSKPSRKNI